MRRRALYTCLLLTLSVMGIGFWRATRVRAGSKVSSVAYLKNWNPKAAATYLDSREVWWQNWPPAQVDHGTLCISCHTVVPYALVQPALQRDLHQGEMPAPEKIMMDSVEKRVSEWSTMVPFYSDAGYGPGKTAESHATEAVLNAVILASHDAGEGNLRPVTRTAFDEAWALQETTGENAGGWKWQDFHLAPWESSESAYQGAALLAVALGTAPDRYASEPEVHAHLDGLQAYLRRQYAAQPLMSQLYVLWASAKLPGLLNEPEKKSLIEKLQSVQQADGGWALSSIDEQGLKQRGWRRYLGDQWTLLDHPAQSDGCATGLAVVAMEEAEVTRQDPTLMRGLEWLERHQEPDGEWQASSLNESRDPNSDVGRFMNDAATGYAVLALEIARNDARAGGTF
jgi:squalene-hopene/tetraprenyl-beta-curcumene cyclase